MLQYFMENLYLYVLISGLMMTLAVRNICFEKLVLLHGIYFATIKVSLARATDPVFNSK